MKKLVLLRMLFLLMLIVIIGSGCVKKDNKINNAEKIKNEALDYLNSNYSDDFSPVELELKSIAYDYDTITFTSKKYNNQSLHVYRTKVDSEYTFSDDYFKLQMNNEANEYFKNLAEPILGDVEAKVRFTNQARPTKLDKEDSFSDYLEAGEVFLELYVFGEDISIASTENKYKVLIDEITKKKISMFVYFIAVNSKGKEEMKNISLTDLLASETELFLERKGYLIEKDLSVKEYELREYSQSGGN